ncbi:MAG: glutamine synthetase [Acidimicrobiia bacterium]|nr:glutamine synthetase [Acidimicrobiia bacterium]
MSGFDQIFDDWESQGIKRVRFELPDLHGTSRAKVVPLKAARSFALKGLNMYGGAAVLDTRSDVVPGSLYNEEVGYGDQLLFPDPATAAIVPWAPDTARLICDARWYDDQTLEATPRAVYRRVLKKAAGMGFEPMTGCEFEFYLLDGETHERLFEGYHIFNVVRNEWVPTINRIVDLMPGVGIDIVTSNCEYAGSQWEINFTPGRGMDGPDKAFTFKNGVKQIGHQDGYLATFMTKPWAGHAGNGCHIHMSLVDKGTGQNVMADESHPQGLSEVGLRFVAGLITHANAIDALLAPTINCRRRRCRTHTFSPTNISWGLEDRSALLRVKAAGPDATRIETRSPSALMNPYLASAAILAAGLDGIEKGLEPPAPSRKGIPAEEDETLEKLPATLAEALDHFEASAATTEFFGQEFKDAFLAVRRYELGRYAAEENEDPDSQRTDEISAWETNEYLELY